MISIPAAIENVPARGLVLQGGQAPSLTIVDSRVEVLASNANTGGRAFIIIENSQPGAGPPLHKHTNEDEFFYILEGTYKFLIEGQEVVACAGASLLAPAGTTHTFANMGPGIGRLLIATFPCNASNPSTFERAFQQTDEVCVRGEFTPETIAAIFEPAGIAFLGPPLAAMGLIPNQTPTLTTTPES